VELLKHKNAIDSLIDKKSVTLDLDMLYLDHNPWLLSWLGKELGCSHSAADVAQDTFLRVLQKKQELESVRTPRAWLRTIAKRLIIDRHRHQQVETLFYKKLLAHKIHEERESSPEEIFAALETLKTIITALTKCSPAVRKAFKLRFFEGWTHAAIADHLGVSTKTIQKYLAKALVLCHNEQLR